MAFDGLVLYTIINELKEKLVGARVDKIYQPENNLITITLRTRGETLVLLLSADPQFARIHFTSEKFLNPPHPPAFCMLLRKYLCGGRIIDFEQPRFERILHIIIQNLNDEGEVINYRLVAELMGRHSNLILLSDEKKILDGIKRISAGISRYREVLPGRDYISPPEQDKANPLLADKNAFIALLQLEQNTKLYQAIMKNYRGISPLIAREIVLRAGLDPDEIIADQTPERIESIWESFESLFAALKANNTRPTLVEDQMGNAKGYSCFFLKQYANLIQTSFDSMSDLLDYYFTRRIKKQMLNQVSSELKKTISNLMEKDIKKREKLLEQLEEARNADDYRIKGEMLTANLHQIKKGNSKFTTINYYDPEMKEISIELDPALSPQINAARYFKRYTKLKTSTGYIHKELEKLEPEIEYLKNVEVSLEQIESREDYEEIREELINEGYITENRKATPNRRRKKRKPLKFKSSDGFDIMVGRNNRQNDELTKGIASREDLWFHAQNIPGSHVVIRNHDRRDIPDRTIEEAAHIAAYYSKGRYSTTVPVDYTLIKYVNKPKGAKPGLVIYDNYQTVIVNPDEALVEKLRVSEE